jgi:hypothetical protein
MEPIPEAAFAELKDLYRRLATELEPLRRHCDSRGICCQFSKCGHMLYLTDLEAAEMARSNVLPDDAQSEAGTCPYLRGHLCGIRDNRAIGCRLYYCDRTYDDDRNALCEKYLKEARAIEAKYNVDHRYRPVTQIDFKEFSAHEQKVV